MSIVANEGSQPRGGVVGTADGDIVQPTSRRGVYGLPVVGKPATKVRDFYDDMRPQATDSLGVTAGKQVLRYGAVVGGGVAGAATMAILAL